MSRVVKNRDKNSTLLIWSMGFLTLTGSTVSLSSARASETDEFDPESATFKEVCGPALAYKRQQKNLKNKFSPEQRDLLLQKAEYCTANVAAHDVADRNKVLWPIWAAVSATCFVECAFFSPSTVCAISASAAGLGELISAGSFEKFMNSMGDSMGAVGGVITAAGTAAAVGGLKPIKPSCIVGAGAALKSYGHHSNIEKNRKTAQSSFKSAASLHSTNPPPTFDWSGDTIQTADNQSLGGSNSPSDNSGPSASMDVASVDSGARQCASNRTSGSVAAYISCATSIDPTIAGVLTPQMEKFFEDKTGQNLGQFIQSLESPRDALMKAGTSLPAGSQSAYVALVKDIESQSGRSLLENNSDTYVASGSGSRSSAAGSDPFGATLSELMGQLLPKSETGNSTAPLTGLQKVAVANQRGPASLAENRELSIFDRVTFRYLVLDPRMRAQWETKK